MLLILGWPAAADGYLDGFGFVSQNSVGFSEHVDSDFLCIQEGVFQKRVGKERPFHGFFNQIFKKFPSYSAVGIHMQSPKSSRSFPHLSFCEASHVAPRSDATSPHHPSLCIPKTLSFLSSQGKWKFKKGSSCWSEEPLLCSKSGPGQESMRTT